MGDEDVFATTDKMLAGMDFALESAARQQKHREEMMATIAAFLPVVDSLEELERHCRELQERGHSEVPARSVSVLVKLAIQSLAGRGVEPMNATGQAVDLDLHEVVAVRAAEGVEEDTVLEEQLSGYLWQGRLLRRARVVICGERRAADSSEPSEDRGEAS